MSSDQVMNPKRRSFLKGSAVAAGAGLAGLPALSALAQRAQQPGGNLLPISAGPDQGGYGPIAPVADLRDGVARISLPQGFNYRTFGVEGDLMSDGVLTPSSHDGMAAFALPNGNVRLIRNHEARNDPLTGTASGNPATAYDARGSGGTTSLEVAVSANGEAQLVRDFQSLNGTIVNCAGGPTPWGTWLTCEETTAGTAAGFDQPHGFVFEVPVQAEDEFPATPLSQLGRFVHEAVAVDPGTGFIYLTEDSTFDPEQDDRLGAGFYRFVPDGDFVFGERPNLDSGQLQALRIRASNGNFNTTSGQESGTSLPVEWVNIDDPVPANAEQDSSAVFRQALANGAAIFNRLEGCWYGNGSVFFNSTNGGDAGEGQIWEYRPMGREFGTLRLVFESPSAELLDNPDNITVSPRGGLLVCEDGGGVDFLRGVTRDGRIFDFAENLFDGSEWAGATFSPFLQTLFVNIQSDPALTFAIWGPFENGAL